jgi:hypothetical protein
VASPEVVLLPTSTSVDVRQVGLGTVYLSEAGGSILHTVASSAVAKFLPEDAQISQGSVMLLSL